MTFRIQLFLFFIPGTLPFVSLEAEPLQPRVVVVAMFELGEDAGDEPGEFQYWVERTPLPERLPFPQGFGSLRWNPEKQVLGVVTGVGTLNSAATIMALGMDPRFDFSRTYWLVAGISGVDPADMSLGSAAWAEWIVDGDLSHQIDRREVPEDWSTGYIPLRRKAPYEEPVPDLDGMVFRLNPELVDWAFALTKDLALMDGDGARELRARYEAFPVARRPPFVLKGDQLAAMTYWHGVELNNWANKWMQYWTDGEAEFVTSAMEDTGTLQSLTFLDRAGKVDVDRVLVLRTASNYTMQHEGITARQSLTGESKGKYSAYIPSLENAWRVGNKVVETLLANWEKMKEDLPRAP